MNDKNVLPGHRLSSSSSTSCSTDECVAAEVLFRDPTIVIALWCGGHLDRLRLSPKRHRARGADRAGAADAAAGRSGGHGEIGGSAEPVEIDIR